MAPHTSLVSAAVFATDSATVSATVVASVFGSRGEALAKSANERSIVTLAESKTAACGAKEGLYNDASDALILVVWDWVGT